MVALARRALPAFRHIVSRWLTELIGSLQRPAKIEATFAPDEAGKADVWQHGARGL